MPEDFLHRVKLGVYAVSDPLKGTKSTGLAPQGALRSREPAGAPRALTGHQGSERREKEKRCRKEKNREKKEKKMERKFKENKKIRKNGREREGIGLRGRRKEEKIGHLK